MNDTDLRKIESDLARESAYRKGAHQALAIALRHLRDGMTLEDLAAWEEEVSVWRRDVRTPICHSRDAIPTPGSRRTTTGRLYAGGANPADRRPKLQHAVDKARMARWKRQP